ncbi:MAG: hypothetical protein ACM3SU_06880 [Acidobacteriota bacterium]
MKAVASRKALRAAAAAILAFLLLEASGNASGSPVAASATVERTLFVVVVLAGAVFARPSRRDDGRWSVPRAGLAVAGIGILAALFASARQSAEGAWVTIAAFFALTLAAASVPARSGHRGEKLVRVLLLAGAAGAAPMAAVEVESRFSHEEIFVALEALLMALVWLSLLASAAALGPRESPARGVAAGPRALALGAAALSVAGLAASVGAYQRSFSPPHAPAYPGVSPERPFLCGEGAPDPETFEGSRVLAELLARVEANPAKAAPEEGMLALATGERGRAAAFRAKLLREVEAGEFSRHGETKHWQYDAALRAYYYPRVRAAFPGLFTPSDERRAAAWFAQINRRALTPGVDDLLYALAFGKRPEGPYENQENGAGLLALLEAGGLAAPDLSRQNRRYLDRAPRGWEARFRNNDDSFSYQPEWIDNAYFLALRSRHEPREAMRRSFRWLLLQAEPDGLPPSYNVALPPVLPATAYLGSILLGDPELLWLSGRSARTFARRGLFLPAQPGVERAVELEARSPSVGTCLLYADSGTPNRVGPLAPDKIVFRDGWTRDSAYLLVNLRFSGWHRYRATNAVLSFRRGAPRVGEKRGAPFSWMPLERRIFRDKRIPREYTNGLLVEPTGFAAALSRLAGFGGPWAQDPPHFARIEAFSTGATVDRSTTAVSDWRGWSHRRSIAFHHGGPIVIVDDASGPSGRVAGISWHVAGSPEPGGTRFRLSGDPPGELVLLPLERPGGAVEARTAPGFPNLDLLYRPARPGRLALASVFLTGRWSGARVELRGAAVGRILEISREGERLSVALP